MIDLEDPRSGKIAEVISNKTAKKILFLLAEREMNGSEIALELETPLNTVGYNLKKLVDTGLIEKINKSFWSIKGKKIEVYKISNKKIVISPRLMIKGVVPAVIGSLVIAGIIKFWTDAKLRSLSVSKNILDKAVEGALPSAMQSTVTNAENIAGTSGGVGTNVLSIVNSIWLWFLIGALSALFIYLLWNFVVRRTR